MSLAQRIKEIRQETGLNKVQFGKLLGVSHSAVNQWENGETKSLKYDVLAKIQQKTGFMPDWVNHGKPPKKSHKRGGNYDTNIGPVNNKTDKLPLISFVRAGSWDDVVDPYELNDAEDWIHTPIPHGPRAFLVRNIGLSMFSQDGDGYPDGAILQMDPDIEAKHGDDVIARTPDGSATFKRLQMNPEGMYLLAINQSWPDRILKVPDGTTIVAVCTGHWVNRRR